MTASAKTPRVLHVGKYFPPVHGGMEVFLHDLVHEQRRSGVDARVLVHGQPQPDDPEWLSRVPVQFELVYAPIAKGFRSELARLLGEFRPDVLHLHMPNNAVFWALTLGAARHVPWVVHWHSDVVVSKIRSLLPWAYQLYRPFEHAMLEGASAVVATSEPYLRASEPLTPWHEKCAVVPLGLARMPVSSSESSGTRNAAPWTAGQLRLLSVGRLVYYKGFETLIRAVSTLPDVELLIAGDGPLRPELARLIDQETPTGQRPRVRLLGRVSDEEKNQLLETCDAFCLASRERTEAFGMVLLEAMAFAKPCVVADLAGSGMPWVVQRAGSGISVPTEDIAAWRDAIRQLRDEPETWRARAQAGRQSLDLYFSIDRCEEHIRRIYAQVAPQLRAQPERAQTLVVMPARDEAATIGPIVRALIEIGLDVLVVDDQSSDGTEPIARQAGAQVMRPMLPLGAWGAMQAGIRYALACGYTAVVTMDADGQHGVEQLPALMEARDSADMIIGAFPDRASSARRIAWQWFRWISRLELTDLTSGFRHYNRRAMAVLASPEATLLDYQDLGTLLLLQRCGLRIREVPVSMQSRMAGKSRIFSSWFKVGRYMAVTTLLCLSRWGHATPEQPDAG